MPSPKFRTSRRGSSIHPSGVGASVVVSCVRIIQGSVNEVGNQGTVTIGFDSVVSCHFDGFGYFSR